MKSACCLTVVFCLLFGSGCVVIPWVKIIPLGDVGLKDVVVQNQRNEPVDFIWKDETGVYAMTARIPAKMNARFDIKKTEPGTTDKYLNWFEYRVCAKGVESGAIIPGRMDYPESYPKTPTQTIADKSSGTISFLVSDTGVFVLWHPLRTKKVDSQIVTLKGE